MPTTKKPRGRNCTPPSQTAGRAWPWWGLDEQQFWQVHRSIIVNHRHIAAAVRVDDGNMHLTLRNRSEKLPVSRHFQALFKGQ